MDWNLKTVSQNYAFLFRNWFVLHFGSRRSPEAGGPHCCNVQKWNLWEVIGSWQFYQGINPLINLYCDGTSGGSSNSRRVNLMGEVPHQSHSGEGILYPWLLTCSRFLFPWDWQPLLLFSLATVLFCLNSSPKQWNQAILNWNLWNSEHK